MDRDTIRLLKIFLRHKDTDINQCNRRGDTILMQLAKRGYSNLVRIALSRKDINVNQQNRNGDTALIKAARKGNHAIVDMLYDHPGSNVEIRNKRGISALHFMVFPVGRLVEARMGFPKYQGTIFEVIILSFNERTGKYTCKLPGFDGEHSTDTWTYEELNTQMPTEPHGNWEPGDCVDVMCSRGEELDGEAPFIWMSGTVLRKKDHGYVIDYDCRYGCPVHPVTSGNMRTSYRK